RPPHVPPFRSSRSPEGIPDSKFQIYELITSVIGVSISGNWNPQITTRAIVSLLASGRISDSRFQRPIQWHSSMNHNLFGIWNPESGIPFQGFTPRPYRPEPPGRAAPVGFPGRDAPVPDYRGRRTGWRGTRSPSSVRGAPRPRPPGPARPIGRS